MSNKNLPEKDVDIGVELWLQLGDVFIAIGEQNGMDTPEKRVAMWAGFVGAFCGSMSADIGPEKTSAIIDGVKNVMPGVNRGNMGIVK